MNPSAQIPPFLRVGSISLETVILRLAAIRFIAGSLAE